MSSVLSPLHSESSSPHLASSSSRSLAGQHVSDNTAAQVSLAEKTLQLEQTTQALEQARKDRDVAEGRAEEAAKDLERLQTVESKTKGELETAMEELRKEVEALGSTVSGQDKAMADANEQIKQKDEQVKLKNAAFVYSHSLSSPR